MAKKKDTRQRNYRREYDQYHAKLEQKKNRALRNRARNDAKKDGAVKKGDGKEIDHKKPLSKGGSNSKSNRRVVSRKANRKKGAK
jgi:5-methylcytosine-specific restriction endonuclease McrA